MLTFHPEPASFFFFCGVYTLSVGSLTAAGKLAFFSEGLLFIHSQYGSITVPRTHIRTVQLYDPVAPAPQSSPQPVLRAGVSVGVLSGSQDSSGVASIFVEHRSSLLPHLPFPLHTSGLCLVFALQPRSKSHRGFFSKVPAPAPAAAAAPAAPAAAETIFPVNLCCLSSSGIFSSETNLSSLSGFAGVEKR